MKRWRKVSPAKSGQLKVAYGRDEDGWLGLVYAYGAGGAQKGDGFMLSEAFERVQLPGGKTLAEELKDRGYDITTLKFSIQR